MIAPGKPSPEHAVSLRDATEEIFRPGGLLERTSREAGFDFEHRPQQQQMALAVAESIEAGRHLAVEAGTGVGKSYAYLVPIILFALREKVQVIVSTYTISLQEQLMYKDIPFLRESLGLDFKAVLVKGQGNYLCLRRLARADKMGAELFKSKEEHELEKLKVWAEQTAEGSLQDLKHQPPHDVWSMVNVEHGNCMRRKCPEYAPCFLFKARRDVQDAHLLVVNHHLFFSDLALRAQGGGILPETAAVVLDEAHQVEGVASEHLGIRLSQYAFEHWMRRLYVPEHGKGILAHLKKGDAAHLITQLGEELDRFFSAVRHELKLSGEKVQQVIRSPIPVPTQVPHLLQQIYKHLGLIVEETESPDMKAELNAARHRGAEMRDMMQAFLDMSMVDHVYWVQREGARRHQTVLYSAPIEVAGTLNQTLFDLYKSVVMTSATLAVNGELNYFKERVGAEDAATVSVGSPFNYERQMKVYIPKGMPDPGDNEKFADACARVLPQFLHMSKGRAFVLFTSDRLMRSVADRMRGHMDDRDYTFFMQGDGLPRHEMLGQFREATAGVLFGLDSFWMGVDVRGEALSNVIITKLPFAVPDEPLIKARMDRIKEKGGDPFRDYALPEAILRFRQGVGRLIRSSTDTGMVVILDPRVLSKWYGKHFMASIPECPVEVLEIED